MSWQHPKFGPINPIIRNQQTRKTWKHFYSLGERWQRFSSVDPRILLPKAEAVLGLKRSDHEKIPRLDSRRWNQADRLVRDHHDQYYSECYFAQLKSDDTVWSSNTDSSNRHFALTPGAIFVVIQLGGESRVVTAYCPHPPSSDVEWSERTLRSCARNKFMKETGVRVSQDFLATLAQDLIESSRVVPKNMDELWRLASSIGYARLTQSDSLREELVNAEKTLSLANAELKASWGDLANWESVIEYVAESLKNDYLEELEEALDQVEDLLVVSPVLGNERKARDLLNELEELLAWLSSDHLQLLARIQRRQSLFPASESLVQRLWSFSLRALYSSALKEKEPTILPATHIADALFASSPSELSLLDAVLTVTFKVSDTIRQWRDQWLPEFEIQPPSPVMSGAGSSDPWKLIGPAAESAFNLRLFVLDKDYPEGYEVTDLWREGGSLWSLEEPGQSANLLVFLSESPTKSKELADLIAEVGKRKDVLVEVKTLTRSK